MSRTSRRRRDAEPEHDVSDDLITDLHKVAQVGLSNASASAISALALMQWIVDYEEREYKLLETLPSRNSCEYSPVADLLCLAYLCPVPGLTSVEAAQATIRTWLQMFGPMSCARGGPAADNNDALKRLREVRDALPLLGDAYKAAAARFHGHDADAGRKGHELRLMRRVALMSGIHYRAIRSDLPPGEKWPMFLEDEPEDVVARCRDRLFDSSAEHLQWRDRTRVMGAFTLIDYPRWIDLIPTRIEIRTSIGI